MNQSKPKSPPARSPLPWKQGKFGRMVDYKKYPEGSPSMVVICPDGIKIDAITPAKAAYLVAAANLLPEMVKFLEEMVTNEHTTTSLGREGLENLLSRAKEALGQ